MKIMTQVSLLSVLCALIPIAQVSAQEATSATKAPVTANSVPKVGSSENSGKASQAASGAQVQQIAAAGMSVTMGSMFASECVSGSKWKCPMAALSFAQVASLFGTAGGAGKAAQGLSTYSAGDPWANNPTDNPNYDANCPGCDGSLNTNGGVLTGGNGKSGPLPLSNNPALNNLAKEYKNLAQTLRKAGVSITPDGKTITMPDGKQIPAAAMGSDAGMKSVGMTDADISSLKASIKAAQAKALSKINGVAMDVDGGGGGGGLSAGGYSRGDSGAGGFNMKMFMDQQKKQRDLANVSGMSKTLGSDRIGVAGDNIFEMVNRRYKSKDDANQFIK